MTAAKVRIYDLYKSLGLESSKDLITILEKQFGEVIKSHSSSIDQSLADKVAEYLKNKRSGLKTEAPPVKSAARPAAAAVSSSSNTSSEGDNDRPMIDPSRVRVIKRQAPPAAEPTPEHKPAQPASPSVLERKTPIVESKRYLLEGGQPPAPQPLSPKAPEHAPATAASVAPVTPRVGTVLPDRAAMSSRTVVERPSDQRPAEEKTSERPATTDEPQRPMSYVAPGAERPGSATAKEVGRKSFLDRSWPQERPLTPIAKKGAPRKTKRQIQAEKMDAIRKQQEAEAALLAAPKIISIAEPMTVSELAKGLRIKETELIKHLFMKGMMVTVNQSLEVDFARTIAKEFEFVVSEEEEELERATAPETTYETLDTERKKLDASIYKNLAPRSPVVSIMGHVDHGKTTLLDAIRETRHKIVDTEAGGITQSIGAYTVEKNDHKIVFLDTPGHEAFTAMRMRGAKSTDIAILVVAADDGVMPQTIEAINHAKAAQIPIIVAVNKIDKAGADPDRVLSQLAEYGLASEKWGGDTLTCEVSALQKAGLDEVLDSVLLVAELLDLKADSTVPAEGVIVEAQLDKRMGPVATALVQQGTLRVGDNVLIGPVGGRVRALIDDSGNRVQEAGPATPVEILGLANVPNAGEAFRVIGNDRQFKQLLSDAKDKEREQRLGATRRSITPGFAAEGTVAEKQFNVIVKADTQGSLEAVTEVVRQLSTEEIKVNVLHSGTGDINEADVMLASTSNALIIGFNVKEDTNAEGLAKQQGILVKQYDVIYHIAEEMEKLMLGQLSPETEEVEVGRAEVRQLFKIGKSAIAGCMVTSGKVVRNAKATVLRDGKEVFSGQLDNLKRFKDDAKEVASGYECGVSFDKFNDLQEGDVIVVSTVKETERTSL